MTQLIEILKAVPVILIVGSASAQTIVDEWSSVKPPPAPELKAVALDAKTTALLILDISSKTCTQEKRPRCFVAIPKVEKLLKNARANKATVFFGLTADMSNADFPKEIAPAKDEPAFQSGPDKFFNTELEKALKAKGIKTVVIAGTRANGAVLFTSATAALKGFKVVVPVETSTGDNAYVEQYTAYHLATAPRIGTECTLTKVDLVEF